MSAKGTKAVKINKLQQLTSRFQSIRMPDDESFDEFYEFNLPKTNKSKSMALKFFDDVDDCEFDDELSSTEIIYLAKNFRNFLRNNNRRAKNRNNVDTKNFKKNDTAKNNNVEKSKNKVSQSSNSSLGQQCYGCQGYGHLKSECTTFLRSKGKAMVITLSDDKVSNHEFESDQEGNFMTFTTTTVVSEIETADKNPSNEELFENADLQEVYSKLCKIAAKDAISVESGLKKINTLEQEKKNLLLKLFDANELLNSIKLRTCLCLKRLKV